MNKGIIISIIVLLIAGVLFFVYSNQDTNPPLEEHSNSIGQNNFDKVPNVSLIDYEGNKIELADFKGTPLVLNSWAVWCPFCRKELSDFVALQEEFSGKIKVIAIDRQESLEKAKGYTDELGITEKILFLLDATDSFYKSIAGFSMPETIFVDGEGNIIVHKRGPMELEEMREHTQKIVNN